MPQYANKSGDSPIESFETDESSISVTFRNGETYTYTLANVGYLALRQMIRLARSGRGLASFISKYARHDFESVG